MDARRCFSSDVASCGLAMPRCGIVFPACGVCWGHPFSVSFRALFAGVGCGKCQMPPPFVHTPHLGVGPGAAHHVSPRFSHSFFVAPPFFFARLGFGLGLLIPDLVAFMLGKRRAHRKRKPYRCL